MLSKKLKELRAARAKLADLEQTIASELAALPSAFGFASAQEFADAVLKASSGGGRRGRKRRAGAGRKAAGKPRGRRKRMVVTEELRNTVRQMAESGKTGSEIKAATGLSLPTIQNIKKQAGLVKSRKKGD